MNPFNALSPIHDRWHAKVVAAQKDLSEAEKALPLARTPAEQTLAFRDVKAKQHALKQILRSRV